jgi:hypothetical protein
MPGQLYYKGQQIITPTLGGGNALAMFLGDVSVGYDARYNFISASGGTITTSGSYKYHTFTGSGDFVVHRQGFGELFLVAGGGGGGNTTGVGQGGGGGAGGVINLTSYITSSTYPIVIGAGGRGGRGQFDPSNGENTTGFGLTALGGGLGGHVGLDTLIKSGADGGSGGGQQSFSGTAGLGIQPSQSGDSGTYGFGNNGSTGGGGAGAAATSGVGGNGVLFEGVYYAGGGGAANGFAGGLGGGGTGANQAGNCSFATTGSPNTGGGGGGGGNIGSCPPGFIGNNLGFAGGSGIVIIKYQYKL